MPKITKRLVDGLKPDPGRELLRRHQDGRAELRPIGKAAFGVLPAPKGSPWTFPARHSFAAMAAGMGYSELTIAGLLGHRVPGITARYAHLPDTALVAADAKQVTCKLLGYLFRVPFQ